MTTDDISLPKPDSILPEGEQARQISGRCEKDGKNKQVKRTGKCYLEMEMVCILKVGPVLVLAMLHMYWCLIHIFFGCVVYITAFVELFLSVMDNDDNFCQRAMCNVCLMRTCQCTCIDAICLQGYVLPSL